MVKKIILKPEQKETFELFRFQLYAIVAGEETGKVLDKSISQAVKDFFEFEDPEVDCMGADCSGKLDLSNSLKLPDGGKHYNAETSVSCKKCGLAHSVKKIEDYEKILLLRKVENKQGERCCLVDGKILKESELPPNHRLVQQKLANKTTDKKGDNHDQ